MCKICIGLKYWISVAAEVIKDNSVKNRLELHQFHHAYYKTQDTSLEL